MIKYYLILSFLYRVFQELGSKLNKKEGLVPCIMLEIVGML